MFPQWSSYKGILVIKTATGWVNEKIKVHNEKKKESYKRPAYYTRHVINS